MYGMILYIILFKNNSIRKIFHRNSKRVKGGFEAKCDGHNIYHHHNHSFSSYPNNNKAKGMHTENISLLLRNTRSRIVK